MFQQVLAGLNTARYRWPGEEEEEEEEEEQIPCCVGRCLAERGVGGGASGLVHQLSPR